MDYPKIYDRLIARAVGRTLPGYTERHHIVPRCMGGSDEPGNLVRLTAEEHFVAHELLTKMHPHNGKLAFAMLALTMNTNGMKPNNKLFGWMRRRVAEAISQQKTGVPRPPWVVEKMRQAGLGKIQSPEIREKHSKAMKGKTHSPEHNAKVGRKGRRSPMTGRQHSEETKAKMRAAATGRKMMPEDVAKMVANKTPEQRRAAALKAWETKRVKNATKPDPD